MYRKDKGPLTEGNFNLMSKLKVVGASVTLALFVPAVAQAKPPTRQHVRQYLRMYHQVRRQFGAQTAGCNLIEVKGSCHVKATDAAVTKSLVVLGNDLAPPPAPVSTTVQEPSQAVQTATVPQTTTYTSAPSGGSGGAAGGLVGCIIRVESSGSPTASNGSHSGLGGWDQTAWQQDGGTKYAPSPTQASYSQQVQVLSNEGNSPQGFGQQTNFEPGHPCG